MAKLKGILKIEGTLDELTFYTHSINHNALKLLTETPLLKNSGTHINQPIRKSSP